MHPPTFDRVWVTRDSHRQVSRQGVGAKAIFGAEREGAKAEQHINERALRDERMRERLLAGLDAELDIALRLARDPEPGPESP